MTVANKNGNLTHEWRIHKYATTKMDITSKHWDTTNFESFIQYVKIGAQKLSVPFSKDPSLMDDVSILLPG